MKSDSRWSGGRLALAATRIWLPLGIAAAGVVLIVIGHGNVSDGGSQAIASGGGVALLLVALIVWMVNWMYRMSIDSNRDREVEEAAREYFDRHGHWPDEAP